MNKFDPLFERIENYIEGKIGNKELTKEERLEILRRLSNVGAYHGLLKRIGMTEIGNGLFIDKGKFYKFRPATANCGTRNSQNEIIVRTSGFSEEASLPASMIDIFLKEYKIKKNEKAPGGI